MSVAELGDALLRPVEELLSVPEKFQEIKDRAMETAREQKRKGRGRRIGFGRPPWEEGGCMRFDICGCCCRRCRGRTVATTYPKRFRLGPFWAEVQTNLQKRLIMGLLFTFFMVGFYVFMIADIWTSREIHCASEISRTRCIVRAADKLVGMVALMVYIPSLLFCLYRIEALDAVLDTMNTIWEVRDIQQAVTGFVTTMDSVADEVRLLAVIMERVLPRLDICTKFGIRIAQVDAEDDATDIVVATSHLLCYLRESQEQLPTGSKWRELSDDERLQRMHEVKTAGLELVQKGFGCSGVSITTSAQSVRSLEPPPPPVDTYNGRLAAPLLVRYDTFQHDS